MEKDIAVDLEYVSTEDLIGELMGRDNEIIIIRENLKKSDYVDLWAKTNIHKRSQLALGFDIVLVTNLLHTAERQLLSDYLEFTKDKDGSDDPQDTREGT